MVLEDECGIVRVSNDLFVVEENQFREIALVYVLFQ